MNTVVFEYLETFVGNRHTGELHKDSCAWVALMDDEHRESFHSLADALQSGYGDPCHHCLPDLENTAMTQQQGVTLTSVPMPVEYRDGDEAAEEIRDGYFHSYIHNNSRGGNEPTFSFLSLTPDFGKNIDDVVSYIERNQVSYLFLIFAGQQYPDFGRHYDEGDRWFCRLLTGGDKLNADGVYRIHASDKYNSVAHALYKHYVDGDRNNALILDVVNTKYNWSKLESNKEEVEAYMFDLIFNKIYQRLSSAARQQLNFFITGFSRGAVFSLLMAQRLKQADPHLNIAAVVTVDPVINHDSNADMRLVRDSEGWGLLKKRTQAVKVGSDYFMHHRPAGMLMKNYFPILTGADATTHYNVFQRRSLGKLACKKPIGSAVEGAISPVGSPIEALGGPVNPAKNSAMFDQYDLSVDKHTPDMLEKYWRWIQYLAIDVLPSLVSREERFVTTEQFDIYAGQQNISNSETAIDRGTVLTLKMTVSKSYANGTIQPYSDQAVRFAVDEFGLGERSLGIAVTDTNGDAELSYTVPSNITEGETWFSAYYPDSASDPSIQRFINIPKLITDAEANPPRFEDGTEIRFFIHGEASIEIAIFTQVGGFGSVAHRKTIMRGETLGAGWHSVKWDGTNARNKPVWRGFYKCRIRSMGGEEVVLENLYKSSGKYF